MPTNAGKQLQQTIKTLVRPNSSLLSVGFILTIYFSSNGMMALMDSFEKRHLTAFRNRPAWKKRLIAIGLTFQVFSLMLASIVVLLAGNWLINYLVEFVGISRIGGTLLDGFRWLVTITLLYFSISLIYRYGTALHQRFRWVTPGATLATILSILSSLAFSFYVEAFDTYNKIYGSIGTIIVIMLWIQINCFVVLVGFELNAAIAENRNLREMTKE
jgi:membrane protein